MSLDEALHGGETDAESAHGRGRAADVRHEDSRLQLRGDAGTIVFDGDANELAVFARADDHSTVAATRRAESVDRVAHQIREDAVQHARSAAQLDVRELLRAELDVSFFRRAT